MTHFLTYVSWTFAIATFLSTANGASCGFASSDEYQDYATCEAARQAYENAAMLSQTPTRRVSTVPCELTVRR